MTTETISNKWKWNWQVITNTANWQSHDCAMLCLFWCHSDGLAFIQFDGTIINSIMTRKEAPCPWCFCSNNPFCAMTNDTKDAINHKQNFKGQQMMNQGKLHNWNICQTGNQGQPIQSGLILDVFLNFNSLFC